MIVVDTTGIVEFANYLAAWPKQTMRAMSLAINDTMRDVVLPRAREIMAQEVNFPAGYLDDDSRLGVEKFSTPTDLEGIVAGRDRPTSLARFAMAAEGPQSGRWIPVQSVEVKPGNVRKMPNAFIIPLRAGTIAGGNVGLAIRLRPGETVRNIREYTPIEIFPDVYILYGPSVDQVFRGVSADLVPEVTSALEQEFMRQFQRLLAENV